MNKLFTIGLTGSTGAGKSEVARIMGERNGWTVIDADVLSRRVVEVGTPTLQALVKHFSTAILNEDGTLDRQALAALAFQTPEQTAALNAIVHPAVIQETHRERELAEQNGAQVVVIDAPLLLQAGLDAVCDYTVAVVSTPALRKARICQRDGLTTEQAERRMAVQLSDEDYDGRVSVLLQNWGDRTALRKAVTALCETIEEKL